MYPNKKEEERGRAKKTHREKSFQFLKALNTVNRQTHKTEKSSYILHFFKIKFNLNELIFTDSS